MPKKMDDIGQDGIKRVQWAGALLRLPKLMAAGLICGVLGASFPAYAPALADKTPTLAVTPDAPVVSTAVPPSQEAGMLLRNGAAALENGDYEKAVNAFTGLLQTPGISAADKAGFLALRGTAYQSLKLSGNAVADFTSALIVGQLPPSGRVPVLFSRAVAYDDLGLSERAMEDLTEVIRLVPGHGPALNNRANLYRRHNQFELALADYETAIKAGHSSVYLSYFGKGLTFEAMNRKDEALGSFVKAFEIAPQNVQIRQKVADYGALKTSAVVAHRALPQNGEGISLATPAAMSISGPASAPQQPSEVIMAELAPLPPTTPLSQPAAKPTTQATPKPLAGTLLAAATPPPSKLPESKTPEANLPEAKIPESKAPESKAPESKLPEAQPAQAKIPESKAPDSDAPKSDLPKSDMPVTQPQPVAPAKPESKPEEKPEAPKAKAPTPAAAPSLLADDVPQLRLKRIDDLLKPAATIATPMPAPAKVALSSTAKEPAVVAGAPNQGGPLDYLVQLAAFRSAEEAAKAWQKISALHLKQLSGLVPIVERADLGVRGIYYRLRAGPFANRASAQAACAGLKAAGQDCVLVDS